MTRLPLASTSGRGPHAGVRNPSKGLQERLPRVSIVLGFKRSLFDTTWLHGEVAVDLALAEPQVKM